MQTEGYTHNYLLDLITGSESAFTAIYHTHFSELYRYCRSITSDKEASDEIIQDVFVSLWAKRESLPEMTSLRAYLFGMVRYKVTDYIRHSKAKQRFEEYYRLFDSVYDEKEERSTDELIALMEKKISELPTRCKETILLRFKENLSYKDIADRMNISVKTVEKQLVKAFAHLRELKPESKIGILLLGILLSKLP